MDGGAPQRGGAASPARGRGGAQVSASPSTPGVVSSTSSPRVLPVGEGPRLGSIRQSPAMVPRGGMASRMPVRESLSALSSGRGASLGGFTIAPRPIGGTPTKVSASAAAAAGEGFAPRVPVDRKPRIAEDGSVIKTEGRPERGPGTPGGGRGGAAGDRPHRGGRGDGRGGRGGRGDGRGGRGDGRGGRGDGRGGRGGSSGSMIDDRAAHHAGLMIKKEERPDDEEREAQMEVEVPVAPAERVDLMFDEAEVRNPPVMLPFVDRTKAPSGTERPKTAAAELLQDKSGEDLYFVQLPSVLPSKAFDPEGNDRPVPLSELPEGLLGKIVVYKSGKIKLRIGEFLFDITSGTPMNFHQEVAVFSPQSSACYILGDVSGRMLITPDLEDLLSKRDSRR